MRKQLNYIIQHVKIFFKERLHYQNDQLPYYITIAVAIALFAVGLNLFIELADELAENELEWFDTRITNLVQSYRTETLTRYFVFITDLGDRYAYVVITVIIAIFFRWRYQNWRFTLQTISVLVLSALSNIVLKSVFNRGRPAADHLVAVDSLSFPSGHSMSAMAFYGFLIYLTTRYQGKTWIRITMVLILLILILSIGISRIYLGVHYPSDVAAGFMGGLIWVALCITIFNINDLLRMRKAEESNID